MIFNSFAFLIFISVFIPVFYIIKGKLRLWFVLLASYFFYGWWDWRFLGLIAFSTILDFYLGLLIERAHDKHKRLHLLLISLITNLSVLGFFKYFNFFSNSFHDLIILFGLSSHSYILNIILPVGISFYTFQSLSYTIDVYNKKIKAEPSLLKFAGYIAFFPQLVAGPIIRASDFLPQLYDNNRRAKAENIFGGLDLVVVGFLKKIVIADSLAPIVDGAFAAPSDFSSLHLLICIILYSFQIYCDFSGYSDIAIGLAKMLGYEFPKNFNIPYIASSFSDFWNRWHISLSSWLKDYLYIPLGGNKKGKFNTYKNLMITMLLGGLWHGANWTFLFWGFLHGAYLIFQRLFSSLTYKLDLLKGPSFNTFIFRPLSILFVYMGVCFAWIFFRSPDFETASLYINGIISLDDFNINSIVNKFWVFKGVFLVCVLFFADVLLAHSNLSEKLNSKPIIRILFYATSIWIICLLGTFSDNQFIYFQF